MEGGPVSDEWVLILDFGSQYTRLIARAIRELEVYCEVAPPSLSAEEIQQRGPKALVLSGGPRSVYESQAPRLDPGIYELGLPILGICYGMQLIVHQLAGRVERSPQKAEYGVAEIEIIEEDPLFAGLNVREPVWMSHGDVITELPPGFRALAYSVGEPRLIAALRNGSGSIYGVQFHPEVHHTPRGLVMLENWLRRICRLRDRWRPGDLINEKIARLREELAGKRCLIGVSGGVDSSVAAVLVHRAVGDRLIPVFVGTGLLRKGEPERVRGVFEKLGLPLHAVDAKREFFDALKGVTDPEGKRKAIGEAFIRIFEREARRLERKHGKIDVLVQGTIYSDVIESGGAGTASHAETIKSHHNVGGLPERLGFELVEPLREFFKDEVRRLGRALGLPDEIIDEQPFPGPGLAVRILGEVTPQKVAMLQEADAVLREEVARAGLHREIWQYFAVLLSVRSVAVRGDGRGYGYVVALRAVGSRDGMTADWYRIPHNVLERISSRITNEVPEVTRVVYDITSKPPGTIEWE
jgi:GMP synthase (glutamine-hydrolysing)